jgi:hypothetical protein
MIRGVLLGVDRDDIIQTDLVTIARIEDAG